MQPTAIPIGPNVTSLGDEQDALYLIDFEAFPMLIDAREAHFSSINPAGKVLLPSLLQNGVDETATRIACRCQVDVETVRRDLSAFVADLQRQGFLPRRNRRDGPILKSVPRGLFKTVARFALAGKTRVQTWGGRGGPLRRRRKEQLRRIVSSLLRWAWWSMRILGWSETLRLWGREPAAPTLEGPASAADAEEAIAVVDELVREEAASRLFLTCACKERALVASYCLRQLGGLPADVVIGIIAVPFRVHAWSVCGERVLTDDPERIARYRPVMRFPLA